MSMRTMKARVRKLEADLAPPRRSAVFRSRADRDEAVEAGAFPATSPFCIMPEKATTTAEWITSLRGDAGA